MKSLASLSDIQPRHISFTIGDSGAEYQKNGSVELLTLKDLKYKLLKYENDYDAFIKATGKHYVEVQLWTDRYITKEYLIM